MLVNLRTIHQPKTFEEAAELLSKIPAAYPIYGYGASILRSGDHSIQELVVINAPPLIRRFDNGMGYTISSGTPLSMLGGNLKSIIADEMPETLSNALTVGDFLMAYRPNSILCALLYAGNAAVTAIDGMITVQEWFEQYTDEQRRQKVILNIQIANAVYGENPPSEPTYFAWERVSRTPKDAPIVAAVGFNNGTAIVTGIAEYPVNYKEGMQSTIDDYLGSAEYRTEMARVLSQRAIARAVALADQAKHS